MKIIKINTKKIYLILFVIIILIISYSYYNNKKELSIFKISKILSGQDKINSDFVLEITKLDIQAPVLTNVDPVDQEKYNAALKSGVVHMNGTAFPGDKGNVFIYGHSSSEIKSPYDKIFMNLNDMETGDQIVVNYKDKIYTYGVREKKIVEKDDLSVTEQSEEKIITLMTCWPIGTVDKRLIIVANQI